MVSTVPPWSVLYNIRHWPRFCCKKKLMKCFSVWLVLKPWHFWESDRSAVALYKLCKPRDHYDNLVLIQGLPPVTWTATKLYTSVHRVEKEAKRRYSKELQSQLQQCDTRILWKGLWTKMDYKQPLYTTMNADASLADEVSTFHTRLEAAINKTTVNSGKNTCTHTKIGS